MPEHNHEMGLDEILIALDGFAPLSRCDLVARQLPSDNPEFRP